ncbi:MAG: DUF58 domain-containing protein [Anaerolineales bacterium]
MNASRAVVLTLLLIGLLGALNGGPVFFSRLFYFSLLLLLGSALWTFLTIRRLEVVREARWRRQRLGEAFEERFELIHHGRIPCAWVEICDRSPLPGSRGSRLVTLVRGGQRLSYLARTWLVQRGHFELGPTVVRTGDPFGLFVAEKCFPPRQSLIVLPMILPLSQLEVPAGYLSGGKTVRQKARDATPHAVSVRAYLPGDPLKHIHWLATARHGTLMVKEFEQDPQTQVWFFLDATAEAHFVAETPLQALPMSEWWFGKKPRLTLPRSTFEYAITAVASLTQYLLRRRMAVGLVTAASSPLVLVAERGWRQEGRILEALAYLRPQGIMPLPELVAAQAGKLTQGSTAILVTAGGDPLEVRAACLGLLRRKIHVLLLWIDRASFGDSQSRQILVQSLVEPGVGVYVIRYGEMLQMTLESLADHFEGILWHKRTSSPWT